MRYLSFTILKYRAIDNPLRVEIEKRSLVPIIGINECGKTTILHAILAFDYCNDAFNKNLHHLDDTNNLYKLGQDNQASVMAEIAITWDDFKSSINKVENDKNRSTCNSYKRKSGDFNNKIMIVRDLHTKKYRFESVTFSNDELNSVLADDGVDAIYLLDEPGSYLHEAAQGKLCKKLKSLSGKNAVIYCTHSHYLLDPETVPVSHVKIASKNKDMEVSLRSIYEYDDDDDSAEKRNAFQPIYDALQIKPFKMDIGRGERAILTEGIYDFYCFDMLLDDYRVVPGQNADSVNYYIALMIGWGVSFNAIWDNDEEGREAKSKSDQRFGDAIAPKTHLLPLFGKARKTILQNLFKNGDLSKIRIELGIPANSGFKRTISTLYYDDKKQSILDKCISVETRDALKQVEGLFQF
jgi:predicted ATP-dependent endonuclease of OLD family